MSGTPKGDGCLSKRQDRCGLLFVLPANQESGWEEQSGAILRFRWGKRNRCDTARVFDFRVLTQEEDTEDLDFEERTMSIADVLFQSREVSSAWQSRPSRLTRGGTGMKQIG